MNDTITKRSHAILQLLFICTAGIATILQIVTFLLATTPNSNYYEAGAILPSLAVIFAILAAAIGTFDAFFSSRQTTVQTKTLRFATVPSAVGFLVTGIHLFLAKITPLGTLGSIFLLLSAIYCILTMLDTKQYKSIIDFIGLATIPAFICLTGFHYFDSTIEMNAPAKLLLQIAFLCSMLFFTGELRFQMGIPAPRTYRMVCAWTIASGALSSLPIILAYLFGTITRADYLTGAILLLGVTITAIIRLFSFGNKGNSDEIDNTETTI